MRSPFSPAPRTSRTGRDLLREDRSVTDVARVAELLQPAPDDFLIAVPVSPRVNNPRNNDAECVTPMGPVIR